MAYPYLAPLSDFAHRKSDFKALSEVSKGTTKFYDQDFSKSMPAIDAINLDILAQKDFSKYSENPLTSCDALLRDCEGHYYLIEFKNQRSGNIDRKEIHKKIIDSLSLIHFCFEPSESVCGIASRVKVYVVFPDQNAFLKIVSAVNESARPKKISLKNPLWDLDVFVRDSFVTEVHTETLSEFKKSVASWPKMDIP